MGEECVIVAIKIKKISWIEYVWKAQKQMIYKGIKWIAKTRRSRQKWTNKILNDLNVL